MVEKLNPQELATVDYYDSLTSEWIESHSTPHYWNTAFERFGKLLPKGFVIEVGAGAGRDAKDLISMGYKYLGTDVSENLLEVARANNPDATFLNRSVYELGFWDDAFDGFWASAVLLHQPKDKVGLALDELHRVTRPGGVGFISLKYGEGEQVESDGRLFSYYDYREFDSYLQDSGLQTTEKIIWPAGRYATWLIYLVKTIK